MASRRRNNDGGETTRAAILDATETIMLEEGYAAVSSRRIAERAGLKSQLVHYHYGTMDDLFLALVYRVEARHFSRYAKVFSARNSLRALWNMFTDASGTELMLELTALAGHRKAVEKEIARCIERARGIEIAVVSEALSDLGIASEDLPPTALAVILAGASRTFITERAIGVSTGHADTMAFIEDILTNLAASVAAARPATAAPNLGSAKKLDQPRKRRSPRIASASDARRR